MNKFFARLFFVLAPALFFGSIVLILTGQPFIGGIVAFAFAGLGIQITEPRPERGEK